MTNSTSVTERITPAQQIRSGFDMNCLYWDLLEADSVELHNLAKELGEMVKKQHLSKGSR